MAVSRDARANRRRRVLRNSEAEQDRKSRSRQLEEAEVQERRRAGYSHDVRRACGQRLVGLIPVSGFSFLTVILLSATFPALLLLGHYMIYVSGSLPWYGHPLAVSLDASHANSLAAWFSSHLWLFCLGATVLTFQIRQHKLDDYHGEYRLWFWLVLTCLLASVDAATHVFESLGLALNPWSQRTLGWSGPAIVKATMTTLIGLLGLRLCSELKSVPMSLLFWLAALFCWAGSAALAQDELRLDMTLQFRIWLKSTLWLSGLTGVWLAALTYLRHVYIEAQERLIARQRKAGRTMTQRLRSTFGRRDRDEAEDGEDSRRGWRLPGFGRRQDAEEDYEEEQKPRARRTRSKRRNEEDEESNTQSTGRSQRSAKTSRRSQTRTDKEHDEEPTETNRRGRFGLGGFFSGRNTDADAESNAHGTSEDISADEEDRPRRGLMSWFGRGQSEEQDEDAEYRKVTREERERQKADKLAERELLREEKARQKAERKAQREAERAEGKSGGWFGWGGNNSDESESAREDDEEQGSRGWFGRRRSSAAEDSEGEKPARRGFFARFSLQPPDDNDEPEEEIRPVNASRSLPSTNEAEEDYDDDNSDRPAGRAERKRQRKRKRRAA